MRKQKISTKSEKGVTLIALIIIVVVMAILAGVAIAQLKGDKGVITQTDEAKENNDKTAIIEQLEVAASGSNLNADYRKGIDVSAFETEIKSNMGITDNDIQKLGADGALPWVITKKEWKFIVGTEGGVMELLEYGKCVNYDCDINGDSKTSQDWKLFYQDGDHFYLIASDYVTAPADSSSAFYQTWQKTFIGAYDASYPYRAYWASAPTYQPEWTSLEKRFMYSGYDMTANITKNNTKAVSRLLNTANWTEFKKDKADYVIGGPTLEMYVASWNTKYGTGTKANTPLYCNNTNANGYYVGNVTNPTTTYISMSSSQGYKDTLYYPHTAAVSNCYGYWLASPSAYDTLNIMCVGYSGGVGSHSYNSTSRSVRPLVSLQSGVKLKWNEEGQYYDIQ